MTESTASGKASRDFTSLVHHRLKGAAAASHAQRLAAEFLSPTFAGQRLLLGRNAHAKALMAYIAIDAIVDDFTSELSWHGKPVIKATEIPSAAILVNCSMSISPVSAWRRLQELGDTHTINYADLLRHAPKGVPVPDFVAQMRDDFAAHGQHWDQLYARLADAASRQVLLDVTCFRLSADPGFMAPYSVRFSDQYFEDFLQLRNEVFVDAGGFTGDTTEEFCKRCPSYQKVFIFEPSQTNMAAARKRLAGYANIEFHELGLSDSNDSLWFDPNAGSASAVSANGSCKIAVARLDDAVSDKVSFIKMDLEGWELHALAGAANHIRQDRPKLAISVYHAAEDFWRIPEYVATLRQDDRIYLRHYTEGWSETVMFFVPQTTAPAFENP